MQVASGEKSSFNLSVFLSSALFTRKNLESHVGELIFSQGEPASTMFYIERGTVKLTVLSRQGKEAILSILGPGNFIGECSVVGLHVRIMSATAITHCRLLQIRASEIKKLLHTHQAFSDWFVSYLISRTIRVEEDLADHLFNSTEKRLARTLLLLARYGKGGKPETLIPQISQATLAKMIGTTRPRISTFMNKFKKLGFVHYNGGINVNSSLLHFVLHD